MYENVQEYLQIRFPFGLAKIQHFKYYKIVSTVAWGTFCEILIEIKRTLNNKFETQCQGPLVI